MDLPHVNNDCLSRLADICEVIPEIVFFSRPDGYCEYLNSHFYDYTGMKVCSAEGGAWEQIVHPADREPNWQRWLLSKSRGKPYALCNRLRRNNGRHQWFLSRSQPLRNSQGEIIFWVGISSDMEGMAGDYRNRNTAEIRRLAWPSPEFLYASEIAMRVNRLATLFSETLAQSDKSSISRP